MTPDTLKTIRATLGLSQAALAKRMGVDRNTVTRWEMGLYPIPLMAEIVLNHFTHCRKK